MKGGKNPGSEIGEDAPGNFALDSTQGLAENVKGVIAPLSGHYIAEEQPDFLIKELVKFFNG